MRFSISTSRFAASFTVLGLCACGSGEGPQPSTTEAVAAAPTTLFTFEGSYDGARREVNVTYHAPEGVLAPAAPTLPYGLGANQVYFHTNSISWSSPTLSGVIDGVNGYGGAVLNLTSVIDSTSVSGVTSSSPSYAHGAANGLLTGGGLNKTENLTWSFNDPTGTSFTFKGHATGNAPPTTGIAIVVATDGHLNHPVCTGSCPAGVPLGGQVGTHNGDTALAAAHCNGLSTCTYTIQTSNGADPAVCCWKDYEVTWLCNGVPATTSPKSVCNNGTTATCEANSTSITLTCP